MSRAIIVAAMLMLSFSAFAQTINGIPNQTITGSLPGITSVTASSGLTSSSDGVHAGIVALVGNTTNPSIPSNQFGFIGFASGSSTAYFFQPSGTAPVTGQYMAVGTPSSGVSALTYATPPGAVVATLTPLTAQGANITNTTFYTSTAAAHYYHVCAEDDLTRAATTSSALPGIQIYYTSAIDSVVKVANVGYSPGNTGNATFAVNVGCADIYVAASTAIQYATVSYASVGATTMQYSLEATVQLVQ